MYRLLMIHNNLYFEQHVEAKFTIHLNFCHRRTFGIARSPTIIMGANTFPTDFAAPSSYAFILDVTVDDGRNGQFDWRIITLPLEGGVGPFAVLIKN